MEEQDIYQVIRDANNAYNSAYESSDPTKQQQFYASAHQQLLIALLVEIRALRNDLKGR